MDASAYRKIFRDVVKGRSDVFIDGDKYYIKHLSALDQVDIDDIKDSYLKSAIDRGIPTRESVLSTLKKDGIWTDKDESEIKRLELFIGQLQENKTQLVLKSQIDKQNAQIKETKEKIKELHQKKQDLIGVNAEDYAEKRSNDYYIIKSFYEDADLEKPMFPKETDFNELYAEDVSRFVQSYNEVFQRFEELTIQTMILQDFYYIYFPFSDDTVGFFW